jgi:hypothetical protein
VSGHALFHDAAGDDGVQAQHVLVADEGFAGVFLDEAQLQQIVFRSKAGHADRGVKSTASSPAPCFNAASTNVE